MINGLNALFTICARRIMSHKFISNHRSPFFANKKGGKIIKHATRPRRNDFFLFTGTMKMFWLEDEKSQEDLHMRPM